MFREAAVCLRQCFRRWAAWAGRSCGRAWGFFNPLLGLRYLVEPTLGHSVCLSRHHDLHMNVPIRHRDVDVKAPCLLDAWVCDWPHLWRRLDCCVRLPPSRKHLTMHEMLGATLEDRNWAPHVTWRAWLAFWRFHVSLPPLPVVPEGLVHRIGHHVILHHDLHAKAASLPEVHGNVYIHATCIDELRFPRSLGASLPHVLPPAYSQTTNGGNLCHFFALSPDPLEGLRLAVRRWKVGFRMRQGPSVLPVQQGRRRHELLAVGQGKRRHELLPRDLRAWDA